MANELEIIESAYRDFNARNLEAVLGLMTPDVVWPNGMEGGYVYGHEGVRAYWTRQWAQIDPHVDPVEIAPDDQGRWAVKVHQVVHDITGNLLLDTIVFHVYSIRDGLIYRMDIQSNERV